MLYGLNKVIVQEVLKASILVQEGLLYLGYTFHTPLGSGHAQ